MKIIAQAVVALFVLASPDVFAQLDIFKGLKDLGKTVEKAQAPTPNPTERRPSFGRRANQQDSSQIVADYCLDDICIGDDISKLRQFQWVSIAEWKALTQSRGKAVDSELKQAVGKQQAQRLQQQDKADEKANARASNAERLKELFKGRVVAPESVLAELAAKANDLSLKHFDANALELFSKIEAVCSGSDHPPGFIGAIKKDSPNKTVVKLEIVHDGAPPNTQRFLVTLIARIFDIDAHDPGAVASLREALKAQFPGIPENTLASPKDGPNLNYRGPMSGAGEVASAILFKNQGIKTKDRPELLIAKGGYFGSGSADQLWNISVVLPSLCKVPVRTD